MICLLVLPLLALLSLRGLATLGSPNSLQLLAYIRVLFRLSSTQSLEARNNWRWEVHPRDEPQLYLELFFTAAFITGIFQLAMGVFRLGILIDFLARSTITGYMGGTAIIIILQQLKGLLGMTHFTQHTDVVSVLHAVFLYRKDWRWESFVLGIIFLCILLVTRHLRKAAPKLFWVSAITPLLLVIIGGIFAFLVHGQNHGIPIVGELKRGLNPISIGKLQFRSKHFDLAFKAGVIAGFIALAEGIAVGRSLAQATNDQIDGNKEMIAYGMMNIVGSFFSCYLTTGPFSKSAVNAHAGSRSQMSNIVQAFIMMLVLLLLAPLFKYTPLVVLSAIIITAMIGLIEYEEVYRLLKVDKFDFVICMTAFLGVIFSEMKTGLMMSVALSIVRALVYVARPHACKLGKISNLNGMEIYRDIEQYPDAASVPGILILQLGSPVYFANASYLRERISRWLEEEDNIAKKNSEEVLYVILDLSGVSSIDNSGIGMLEEVNRTLQIKGIRLALANPRIRVVDKLVRSKVIDQIGSEWVFLTIKESVKACLFSLEETKLKGQNP
ncbi:uncharacterized protein A4U43_C08F6170 [Asparagus officinalis]|nr:uncharacterized protein A4U43_C08F6170 [Asparagus officinalis]